MKNSFFLFLLVTTAIFYANCSAQEIENCYQPEQNFCFKEEECLPKKWKFVSQVGFSLEERTSFADMFIYLNQIINDHWFYELRLYGIRNFIVNNPPTGTIQPVPHPTVNDERNQWGWAAVGIAGYMFDITDKVKFMPFFRYEFRENAVFTYRDKFGNKVNSTSNNYFIGARLSMSVNDVFSYYVQYFGGYCRNNFKGSGYFATTSPLVLPPPTVPLSPSKNAHYNSLAGIFELGAPYKFGKNKEWVVIPFLQLLISDNNIRYLYTVKPYSLNPLTTSTLVYGVKFGREF